MVSASVRRASVAAVSTLALAGVAAARGQPFPDAGTVPDTSPLLRFVGGFVVNLIVAGIIVTVAPSFTKRMMGTARDDPVLSFGYGLVVGVAAVILTLVLAATGIGILLAIPLILALAVAGVVGGACAFVLVGALVLEAGGEEDPSLGWSVVAGSVAAGVFAAVPILGGLAEFVVGTVGLGALVVRWRA